LLSDLIVGDRGANPLKGPRHPGADLRGLVRKVSHDVAFDLNPQSTRDAASRETRERCSDVVYYLLPQRGRSPHIQPQFFHSSVDFAPHLMVGILRCVLKKMNDSIDKAVDDICVDKSWGIAGGPAKLDLDRVAIFGHPSSKPKQNPFEDGPVQIEFDNCGHQTINDCDEVNSLSL
jgi:hypothetical protein